MSVGADDYSTINNLHIVAIGAVRKKCGNYTIAEYVETTRHGVDRLTYLFRTVGADAARAASKDPNFR